MSDNRQLLPRVADAVRQIRDAAEGLTRHESKFLTDCSQGRYFGGLERISDIAKYRCRNPANATAFAEAIRGYTLSDHPGMSLPFIDTLRYEGATNTMADEALTEFLLYPSAASHARMVETHHAQMVASRAVVDLMHSTRVPLWKSR